MDRVAILERNLEGRKGGTRKQQPPFPLLAISKDSKRRPPEQTDTPSCTSLTIGAVSSFSARESARSESHASECSSLAPYWIPEQIKHYFRHRHSEEDNTDKTDMGLRAIGLERELPAIDDTDWARWAGKLCHTYRYAVAAVVALVTGTLLALLLAEVMAEFKDTLPGPRSHSGGIAAPGEDSAASPNNEAGHGDFLMPMSNHESKRDKEGDTPEEAYTARHHEVEEVTGNAAVEEAMPDREDGTKMHSGARKGRGKNGNAGFDESESAACGGPAFRFCSGAPAEFFYNGTARACMTLTPDGPGLCNHGRNRFTSLEDCWEQCVDSGEPLPKCFHKAVFAECEARDIMHTWWWYLDGKGCRHWRFPRGDCPSLEGGNVFRTASECVRRCFGAKGRKPPCIAPKSVPCHFKQMRFGYVADTSPHGARRCRELPSAGGGGKVRHCLAGANKFPTLEACQRRCVNA